MKLQGILKAGLLWLACFGTLFSPLYAQPIAAGAAPLAPAGCDVALQEGGLLAGQVIDANGAGCANVALNLGQAGRNLGTAMTDDSGRFAFRGLRGGTYLISVGPTFVVCRLWAPGTAPPSAQPGVMVVVDRSPVRGQAGPLAHWLSNLWVLTGIIVTAVAVPVVLHHDRVRRSASP